VVSIVLGEGTASTGNAGRDLGLHRTLGLGAGIAASVCRPARWLRRPAGRWLAGGLLAFMLAVGAGAGWKALYPLAVFAAALGTSLVRSRLSRRTAAGR
jgi:hypothetical protein